MSDQFQGFDELREWARRNGFRVYRMDHGGWNACNWSAHKIIPGRTTVYKGGEEEMVCISIHPYEGVMDHAHLSFGPKCQVCIVGQAMGTLFDIRAYEVSMEDIRSKYPQIEQQLLGAWNGAEL